jgi:hypothetical protein
MSQFEVTTMQDEELTALILRAVRDSRTPTHVEDLVEIARSHGVEDGYQIHRIGGRLRDQGLVDDVGFTEQSLLATINERGIAALERGDFHAITEQAKAGLLDPQHNLPAQGDARSGEFV